MESDRGESREQSVDIGICERLIEEFKNEMLKDYKEKKIAHFEMVKSCLKNDDEATEGTNSFEYVPSQELFDALKKLYCDNEAIFKSSKDLFKKIMQLVSLVGDKMANLNYNNCITYSCVLRNVKNNPLMLDIFGDTVVFQLEQRITDIGKHLDILVKKQTQKKISQRRKRVKKQHKENRRRRLYQTKPFYRRNANPMESRAAVRLETECTKRAKCKETYQWEEEEEPVDSSLIQPVKTTPPISKN
ncbi:unnamed protein product [Moneuplotes crassus]|uniref:Uncharacterized protein n=1 Tax=Euplotes crassus TaxID=5936 RepID=A0AAD1XMN6_EUPCR|nr:unnamed protein product [Moneuplotes crassus]